VIDRKATAHKDQKRQTLKRIAAELRQEIEALSPGEHVPSVSAISERFSVSRNTSIRALKLLKDEGLITTEQGWGSFRA
jgi:DNA-binding GntR family transcriptional regulator